MNLPSITIILKDGTGGQKGTVMVNGHEVTGVRSVLVRHSVDQHLASVHLQLLSADVTIEGVALVTAEEAEADAPEDEPQ